MNYYIYAVGETFDVNNVYHHVEATSPKKAACIFALNEESLYGICDNQYNVYDCTGNMITRIDVSDRRAYNINQSNNTVNSCKDDLITPPEDFPFDLSNGVSLEGGSFSHLGTYDDADIIGVSPTKFSNTESDDDCVNVDTNMLNALSKIIQQNMDKYDSLYNPLIAREFLKSANFSTQFVNKYGFFIGESDLGLLGTEEHKLYLVFTGNTKESNWPEDFNRGELDQLHNIGAVLNASGVAFFEATNNVWMLSSKRWNMSQIATIVSRIMIKCKLSHTGMHPMDLNNDHLWEYKGKQDIPPALGFLM